MDRKKEGTRVRWKHQRTKNWKIEKRKWSCQDSISQQGECSALSCSDSCLRPLSHHCLDTKWMFLHEFIWCIGFMWYYIDVLRYIWKLDISGYRIFPDSEYFRIPDISGYFRIFPDISGYFQIPDTRYFQMPDIFLDTGYFRKSSHI